MTTEIEKQLLPNEWQIWIAKNLMQGVCHNTLIPILKKNKFSDILIRSELQLAMNSPYLTAGKEMAIQLRRRNWLLDTQDQLSRLNSTDNANVNRITTPSFEYFIQHYYSQHKPVVLTEGINHWQALKKWSPEYFSQHFGDKEVQIQFDRDTDTKFEINSVKLKKEIMMSEFVSMIEAQEKSNNFYMTANNTAQNVNAIREAFNDLGDFGTGYRKLVSDPTFNTFFWMGPKGTFTPMHFDLTNNMLVQIYGTKKVTLVPANQVPLMYNNRHVFSDANFPHTDFSRYPLMQNITPIEVILKAGEALFIPIGWWHCVEGLTKSISISFTNFNAANHFGKVFKDIQ